MTDGERRKHVAADAEEPLEDASDEGKSPTDLVKRFHEASSPFQVERELKLAFQLRRPDGGPAEPGSWEPGDQVQVVITATDALGKPVAAQLSLAMVEQSLLRQFPRTLGRIDEFLDE